MARRRNTSRPARAAEPGRTALPDVQTPYQIIRSVQTGRISEQALRSQYTVLRDRAQKQLKRLMKSDYGVPERWAAEARRGSFFKLSELRDTREIAYAMANLQEFINAPMASVRGRQTMARSALNSLHSHGYTGIKKSNLAQFGNFMEAMRQRMGGRKSYPSGDLAQFFSDSKNQGIRLPVRPDRLEAAFNKWREENPD